jgi:hypothetical protein
MVLLRYAYGVQHSVAPGSIVITANCGHRAYISPEGVAWREGDGADTYTICDQCAEGSRLVDDPEVDKHLFPGVLDSIYRWKGTAEGDQVKAWAKDKGFKGL